MAPVDNLIESPLLTFSEAVAYLNVTESWLRRARSERRIPAVKIGRYTHFRLVDLESFIEDNYDGRK